MEPTDLDADTSNRHFQSAAAGFDAKAIPTNQAGRLSPGQRLKLLSNPASYFPLAIVALIAGGAVYGFVDGFRGKLAGTLFGIFALVIILPLAVLSGWTWLSPLMDAAIGKAKEVQGQLSWGSEREEYMNSAKSVGKMYLTTYELLVGGTEALLVSGKVQSMIPQGGPYRVFFAPLSRTAVNIEALPGWIVKSTDSVQLPARILIGSSDPEVNWRLSEHGRVAKVQTLQGGNKQGGSRRPFIVSDELAQDPHKPDPRDGVASSELLQRVFKPGGRLVTGDLAPQS